MFSTSWGEGPIQLGYMQNMTLGVVLYNISVDFEEGMIHGIIGRNGSGKTILLASHNKEDIDVLCDNVYEMDHGVIEKNNI